MPSTINTYFSADHDRLDALFAFTMRCQQVSPDKAQDTFKVFHQGLLIHIAWEEQVLFPIFEAQTGITEGPTRVMRMEHERIKTLCDDVQRSFEQQLSVMASLQQLQATLEEHNHKEENILYPAIDRLLDEQTLANALVSMSKLTQNIDTSASRLAG